MKEVVKGAATHGVAAADVVGLRGTGRRVAGKQVKSGWRVEHDLSRHVAIAIGCGTPAAHFVINGLHIRYGRVA
ncbi:protein of unknown function [Paraburkholderia kururiensis]